MKKLCSVFAAILIALGILPFRSGEVCCAEEPEISAKAAVLISADTGEIIYEHNSSKKLPMASTTKIMTTLLCLESGGLYEEFVVDSEAIRVEGSSMGLREGDIVTKYALCCGMLLPSGNDAANAAAVRIAGNIEDFAVMMNDRAREMGLSRTFFVTPSGLEGEGHGSSAYDMAILAREALKNEMFREICSQTSIQLEFGNPPYKRWLKNTNKLLTMCDGVYGVKTGFTDEAGRCHRHGKLFQGNSQLIAVSTGEVKLEFVRKRNFRFPDAAESIIIESAVIFPVIAVVERYADKFHYVTAAS